MEGTVRLPGFTAECCTTGRGSSDHAAQHLFENTGLELSWNRTGSPRVYFPPDSCPPGSRMTLVQTGGETICLRWVAGLCIFEGTPFEKCQPDRCINWQTSKVESHWECQPRLFTIGD